MGKAIVTKDNFIYKDVTDQMKYGEKAREALWYAHELYAIYDDDSESLLESHEEIDEAIKLGLNVNRGRTYARNNSASGSTLLKKN